MPRAYRTLLVPVIPGALALALALATPGPADAQPRIPTSTTWEALPYVVGEGATVVVRTRDGSAVKGRLHRLSDTAIVLDGSKVRTIPAASIVSIEGRPGLLVGGSRANRGPRTPRRCVADGLLDSGSVAGPRTVTTG